jgi:hypothetical protein
MKMDKNPFKKSVYGKSLRGTIGLSIVLVAVVALAVFSASFPASGTKAVQNATVTQNTTAIVICAQGGNTSYLVSYWNFTGYSGAINETPVNNWSEQQNPGQEQHGICTLNNTNTVYPMTTYIKTTNGTNNGDWSDPSVIEDGNTWYNRTSGTAPTAIDLSLNHSIYANVGTIDKNANMSVWVKVQFRSPGTANSLFTVTAEA